MIKIVGVRFRNAGKIYYFGPGNLDLTAGMHVIVETARGVELGTVMIPTREVNDDSVIQPLKPVIRIATEADEKTALKNREKEKEAFKICLEKIAKHKLDMKLVEAEYTFDNNKLLFYFTADGRIDFRELGQLTFDAADMDTFRCLALAERAGKTGGTMPCVLNAANEVAVDAFLHDGCSFTDIDRIVESCMDAHDMQAVDSFEQLHDIDAWAREKAAQVLAATRS